MEEILTIQITQKHIDAGKRHSPKECPLALAALDAGCTDAYVDRYEAYFEYKGEILRDRVTGPAIARFFDDSGGTMVGAYELVFDLDDGGVPMSRRQEMKQWLKRWR